MPTSAPPLRIALDDLTHPALHALLQEHLDHMYSLSPPESVHALDLDRLRAPDVSFWSVWDGEELVGCGALKALDACTGELKSMRTPQGQRRRGAGRAVLRHMIDEARRRGYTRLYLETGPASTFGAAHALYRSEGFEECGPFADYVPDPYSVFMTRAL